MFTAHSTPTYEPLLHAWSDFLGRFDWDSHITLKAFPAARSRDAMDAAVRVWLADCEIQIYGYRLRNNKGWRLARSVAYEVNTSTGEWHCHILIKLPEKDTLCEYWDIKRILRQRWCDRHRNTKNEYWVEPYAANTIQSGYGSKQDISLGSSTTEHKQRFDKAYSRLGWCEHRSVLPDTEKMLRKCGLHATRERLNDLVKD